MGGVSASEIATHLEDLAKQARAVPAGKGIQKKPASGSEDLQKRPAAVSGAASSSGQGAAPVWEDAALSVTVTMGQMPMEKYQDGMGQLSAVINHVPVPKRRPRKSVLLQGGDPMGITSE